MATNYKIVKNIVGFDVIETQTGYVVYTNTNHDAAKKMMRHLNLGGGFDGNTPTFFTKSFKNVSAAD